MAKFHKKGNKKSNRKKLCQGEVHACATVNALVSVCLYINMYLQLKNAIQLKFEIKFLNVCQSTRL